METDILMMWEAIAARREQEWEKDWSHNKEIGSLVYWRDVVPYKYIVRALRLRASQAICWGSSDCLDLLLSRCAGGKHETCQRHRDGCFLCEAEG
jgi:hypothetical protein